jgi:hypothetical protein
MNKSPGLDLAERARALQPLIARDADEIERTRRLTPAVTEALIENGLYRVLLPKSLGGGEVPLEAFMQMQEEIAKADASTAWCLGQCSVCAMTAAYLDPDAANDVGALPPKQKQLAEQERTHNMTATLQEAIGRRGRVDADALGKSRLTDVTNDGRVDEAVRQSDDQNSDDDNDGAKYAVAYDRRPHETDHHKAHAAHDGDKGAHHAGEPKQRGAKPEADDVRLL